MGPCKMAMSTKISNWMNIRKTKGVLVAILRSVVSM